MTAFLSEGFIDSLIKHFSDDEKDDRRSEHSLSSNPDDESSNDSAEDELMWFEHEPCFRYWVDRGTRTVHALGIELVPGVIR